DDPLGERRRLDAVRHVLSVDRADRVVVAADAADPAGDEVRVPRVLAAHEHAVPAEHRRGALTLDDLAVLEVDLGIDPEVPDDPGDRVPGHLNELPSLLLGPGALGPHGHFRVPLSPSRRASAGCSRW